MKHAGMIPHYALNSHVLPTKSIKSVISPPGPPEPWHMDCDILSLIYR